MSYFRSFFPILLFVIIFVGSGSYFTYIGAENAFYKLSPIAAIIPAIALGWLLNKGPTEEKMNDFLDGVRHRDIITMCIIFLLAGAFGEITKQIGSVDATVNLALTFLSPKFLLIGLFLIAAFISTSIGTSMGTIATVAPIAAGLSAHSSFSAELAVATVVSGAMFGDNLSIISDSTIASVMSQKADPRARFLLNARVALVASVITIIILFALSTEGSVTPTSSKSPILVAPYIFLILIAISGVNVFISLVISLAFAAITGWLINGYGLLDLSRDITNGFANMQEIMILSLMVGGLSGLSGSATKELALHLGEWISKHGSKRMAQLVIAKIVSIFDILLANNTIAIIFSGEIARNIATKHNIPPHYTASWLDIFSCVFQGILPYGAQILLASIIAGTSPLSIVPHVYYCYILGIVSILHIIFIKIDKKY